LPEDIKEVEDGEKIIPINHALEQERKKAQELEANINRLLQEKRVEKDQNEGVMQSLNELMMANSHLKDRVSKMESEKKQLEKNIKTITTKLLESDKKNKNFEKVTDWNHVLDHFNRGRVNVN
jgi:septal ring factor EnvC (AmiA/AmiB activator)